MGAELLHAGVRTEGRTDIHDEANSRFSEITYGNGGCYVMWQYVGRVLIRAQQVAMNRECGSNGES